MSNNKFDYQELDTAKYWLPIRNRDFRMIRKLQRQQLFARIAVLCFFVCGGVLGYLYCTGQLETADILAKLDNVKTYFGS